MPNFASLAPLAAALFLLGVPARASAQDAAAPSLAVRTDHPPPSVQFALSADLVAPVFGRWGAQLEVALVPAFSVSLAPAYVSSGPTPALQVELGARLWPLGGALDGLFVGPAVAGVFAADVDPQWTVGGEAGWQWLWQGLAIAVAGGAGAALVSQSDWVPVPRVRLALGYAF